MKLDHRVLSTRAHLLILKITIRSIELAILSKNKNNKPTCWDRSDITCSEGGVFSTCILKFQKMLTLQLLSLTDATTVRNNSIFA